jgi:hypothetical protein
MPAERLTMRKIREVFRLKFECELSNRKIAKAASSPAAPSPNTFFVFSRLH